MFWLHTSIKAKHNRMYTKIIATLSFFTLFVTTLTAQQEWKNWNAIRIEAPITKKFDVEIGHTRSYNISNQYKNDFNQTAFQFQYRQNRKWSFSTGAQFLKPVGSTGTRTRVFVRAAYTTRIIDKQLNWTNSLRVDHNSVNETRFRQRIILGTRLSLRNRLSFLNLSPSVSYNLFYNIGGNSIPYYDAENKLIERSTPDGFHRGRFVVNLNSKINDYLQLSVYLMAQREFNLLSSPTNKMNVFDPVRNRVIRPFDNYNVVGLTLGFSLNDLF